MKINGMRFLTHSVMEKLVKFYNDTKIKYDVVIRNEDIYIRLFVGDVFEAKYFKDESLPKEVLLQYYNIMRYLLEFSELMENTIKEMD